MIIRGECLPLRGNEHMKWKYKNDKCVCGMIETEAHLRNTCEMYKDERDIRLYQWWEQMGDEDDMVGLKGYDIQDERLDKSAITYLSKLWQRRTSMESRRIDPDENNI